MIKQLLTPLLLIATIGADAQLIKNGSFEEFTGTTCVTGAGCVPCYACATNTVMPNWQVTAGNVDIMSTTAPLNTNLKAGVPNGIYGVDLNGTAAGTISQEVSNLVAEAPYTLTFWYSNNDINIANCAMDKPLQVNVYDENDVIILSRTYRTDTMTPRLTVGVYNITPPRWAQVTLNFTPESNFAKIEFKSLFGISGFVSGCGFGANGATGPLTIYGPTLDNIILEGPVLLPINLLSFNGTYAADALKLAWKTADEQNLKKMVLQYDNGVKWEEVGSMPAKGSGSNDYNISIPLSVVKNAPNVALRLKLLSADNKISYSQVIYLQSKITKKSISIFPNPVTRDFINVSGLSAGQTIMIYNSVGQLLLTRKVTSTYENIDLGNSPAGLYNITVVSKSGNRENFNFVKSK